MRLRTKEQLRAFIKENKLVTAKDAQDALKVIRRDDSGNAGGRDGCSSRL